MSKKHKQIFSSGNQPVASQLYAEEYLIIKHDLIRVLILNAIYLAAVLVLYYTNLHKHYLEHWFGKILHF